MNYIHNAQPSLPDSSTNSQFAIGSCVVHAFIFDDVINFLDVFGLWLLSIASVHPGLCIQICSLTFRPQILPSRDMCTREVTLECQQPKSSSRTRIPYVWYNTSLIEAAENVEILMNAENIHCFADYVVGMGWMRVTSWNQRMIRSFVIVFVRMATLSLSVCYSESERREEAKKRLENRLSLSRFLSWQYSRLSKHISGLLAWIYNLMSACEVHIVN